MKLIKFIKLLTATTGLTVTMGLTAFAGQWKKDNIGYWYQNNNGAYPKSSWQSINDKWYYFNDNGYMIANQWVGNYFVGLDGAMLINTTTPDGYKVGADGAWIQNNNSSAENSNYSNVSGSSSSNNTSNINYLPISLTPFDGYTIVVNMNTRKYHVPTCHEISKMADRNIAYSREIAVLEAAGYKACKKCH